MLDSDLNLPAKHSPAIDGENVVGSLCGPAVTLNTHVCIGICAEVRLLDI